MRRPAPARTGRLAKRTLLARPKTPDLVAQVRSIAGMLSHRGKPRWPSLTDDEAVLRMAAEDDARIRAYARKRRRK